MKLQRVDGGHFLAQDPVRGHICSTLNTLAELAAPKTALKTLDDPVRLASYQTGMEQALHEQPGGRRHPRAAVKRTPAMP